MEIKTYSVKELTTILKVSEHTIRKYINQGRLKASKVGSAHIVNQNDLLKFLKANTSN